MKRRVYDKQLADQSAAELAVVTDEQLAADVRAAIAVLAAALRQRVSAGDWPVSAFELRAYNAAVNACQATLEFSDASLQELIRAVSEPLEEWWPDSPALERPLFDAIERLRVAAMHRPNLVSDARRVAEPHG